MSSFSRLKKTPKLFLFVFCLAKDLATLHDVSFNLNFWGVMYFEESVSIFLAWQKAWQPCTISLSLSLSIGSIFLFLFLIWQPCPISLSTRSVLSARRESARSHFEVAASDLAWLRADAEAAEAVTDVGDGLELVLGGKHGRGHPNQCRHC